MKKRINIETVHPREVADKSIKGNLEKAIDMALKIESDAVRHNTQSFNKNRYKAIAEIDDYQDLRDQARQIKEKSIANLPILLQTLKQAVLDNGGHFYLAKDAADARQYITSVCQKHQVKLAIKAKSITSEEIKLNHALQEAGIEVAETDLAEFILQVSGEQPSHIVAPAIHRSRERISELFKSHFKTDLPLDSGEDLTKFARDILRQKFLSADVGISGANVIAADSGTLLLVESEGNIRMVTQAPSLHIALAGIEKVVPTRRDLIPFLELLAPSATGQPLTSYTHIIKPPLKIHPFSFNGRAKKEREFHLVLIDNGRMKMREDPVFREALYCIRCSACMNVCPNFQVLGGHAFGGETYPGGIGGSWEAGTGSLQKARFSELCTGCSRCVPYCPVKIDIPWLNENLRFRLNQSNEASIISYIYQGLAGLSKEEANTPLQKVFFANYAATAKVASALAPLSNRIGNLSFVRGLAEKLVGADKRRPLPEFHRETLVKKVSNKLEPPLIGNGKIEVPKVLLFADVYTNYLRSEAGLAAVKILNAMNVDVEISKVFAEGRAALSQGMLATAKKRAQKTMSYVKSFLAEGREIVVVEPSVLALFRRDYAHFLEQKQFNELAAKSFDSIEFIFRQIKSRRLEISDLFDLQAIANYPTVFFHSHCQQRSLGAEKATIDLLNELGIKLIISTAECCGMAGSFGHKKEFYEVSIRVGDDLAGQIASAKNEHKNLTIIASGISCAEQIENFEGQKIIHPLELLAKFLKDQTTPKSVN